MPIASKKIIAKTLLLATGVSLLSACAPKLDTVEYWQSHQSELSAKLASCGQQPSLDPVCLAAFSAEPVQAIDFWRTNKEAHKQKFTVCKRFISAIGKLPNCDSAFRIAMANFGGGKPVYATHY